MFQSILESIFLIKIINIFIWQVVFVRLNIGQLFFKKMPLIYCKKFMIMIFFTDDLDFEEIYPELCRCFQYVFIF